MTETLLLLFGSAVGIWAVIKYCWSLVLYNIRIDSTVFEYLFNLTKDKNKFLFTEEFSKHNSLPAIYNALILSTDFPICWVSRSERLLTAGFSGVESIASICCFRFSVKKIKTILEKAYEVKEYFSPVEILGKFYNANPVIIKSSNLPMISAQSWKDIDGQS